VVAVSALMVATGSPIAASASQGSVPGVVAAYASDPAGLVARLADLFGPGKAGKGITFDDTTKVGQLNRAFAFTPEFTAGTTNENPIRLTNEWTAPITVAGSPVGLATIWINPQTNDPELADFVAAPGTGKALTDVPADAYLIHDAPRGAWVTLQADVVTALVPGSTGLTGPTTTIDYRTRVLSLGETNSPVVGAPTGQGAINSIVIVSVAVLVTVAILLAPAWRRRRAPAAAPPADSAESTPPDETP